MLECRGHKWWWCGAFALFGLDLGDSEGVVLYTCDNCLGLLFIGNREFVEFFALMFDEVGFDIWFELGVDAPVLLRDKRFDLALTIYDKFEC